MILLWYGFFLRYYFGFWNHLQLRRANCDFICHSRCYFWFSLPVFVQSHHTGLILSGKLALLWDSFHNNLHSFSNSFTVLLSSHVSLSWESTPPFSFPCFLSTLVLSLLFSFLLCVNRCKTSKSVLSLQDFTYNKVWDLEPRCISPLLGSKTKWGRRQNLNDSERATRKKFAQCFWLASWQRAQEERLTACNHSLVVIVILQVIIFY